MSECIQHVRVLPLFIVIFHYCAALVFGGDSGAACTPLLPFHHELVYVGTKVVRIPAPAGFGPVEGAYTANRETWHSLVAFFAPLKNNPEDEDRICYVQTIRSAENLEIGDDAFYYFKMQTKGGISQRKLLKAKESTGNDEALQEDKASNISDVEALDCIDDSATSIGYTLTMNVMTKTGGDSIKVKRVYSFLMMPVRGKLCYLYVDAKLHTDEDRQWTEKTVKAWRKAILAVNPLAEHPPTPYSFFDEVEILPLLGGILGASVSIFVMLFQHALKHRASLALLMAPSNTRSNPPSAGV